MEILCDLAQKEVASTAQQLAQARCAQRQADEQLTQLLQYQREYRCKLNDELSSGITSTRWHNCHQFGITLEKAIHQQRVQLVQCNSNVELALQCWRDKQQRLNAFQSLHKRAVAKILQQQNRLEQMQMDEFAQRVSIRKDR